MGPWRRLNFGKDVLYPNHYTWLVFVSAMDIMMTCTVIVFGGHEVNVIANFFLRRWGLPGMVMFKFALVVVVIGLCELIGRRNRRNRPVAGAHRRGH